MTFWWKKTSPTLQNSYFGKRYAHFLSAHGFTFEKDATYKTDFFSALMTIVRNTEMQMAFSMEREDGEMIYVAPLDAPADPKSVVSRANGWSMSTEVWGAMNKEAVAEWEKNDHRRPNEERLRELTEKSLFEFMQRMHAGEFDIRHPKFRLEDDPEETDMQRMMREQMQGSSSDKL